MNSSHESENPISLSLSTKETHVTSTTEKNSISASVTLLYSISGVLWQIVPLVLLVCGTFGNVMIVVVMRKLRGSRSTACLSLYFTALAVSDQCLLTTAVSWYWGDITFTFPASFYRHDLLCTIPDFLWYTSSLTSAWFLVTMTYQRVTSVVAPHRVGILCTVRRGRMVIVLIVSVACALNFHFLFTRTYSSTYGFCISVDGYRYFVFMFTWVDLCLASVIPFLALITGNSILIWQVLQSMRISQTMRGNVDKQLTRETGKSYPMTKTLILTSVAFLILTGPTCIFDAYNRTLDADTGDAHFRAVLNMVETVTLLLWFSASALNFYIYMLSGSKFREDTKRCLLCWRQSDLAQKKDSVLSGSENSQK